MAEENRKEDNPKFDLKNIPVNQGPVKIRIDGSKHLASGNSEYGPWWLWAGHVEDQKVVYGRGADERTETGYSGKVVFFTKPYVQDRITELIDGKSDVELGISRYVEEGGSRILFKVEKLSEGQEPQSALDSKELQLVQDAQEIMKKGFKLSEDDFVRASKEEQFEGKVSEERARELYKEFLAE